jgi:hypothetical protein
MPELCNACREGSTHLSSPSDEHWKERGRLVGYIKHGKQNRIMHGTSFQSCKAYPSRTLISQNERKQEEKVLDE